MINWLHLLWIVPVSASTGMLILAFIIGASGKILVIQRREKEKPE